MNAELWIDVDSVYFNYSLNCGDTGFLAPGVIRFVFIDSPGCHYPERNERVLSTAPICTLCPGCQHPLPEGWHSPPWPVRTRVVGAQGALPTCFIPQLQAAAAARGSPGPRVYPTLTPSLFLSPVPIDATQGLKMLYVFVDIKIDTSHFLETIRFNFAAGTSLALVSTIQFVSTVQVRWGPAAVPGVGWGLCLPPRWPWLSPSLPWLRGWSGCSGVPVVTVPL